LELTELKYRFKKIIEISNLKTPFDFYVFGSFLTKEIYVDIDILILYEDHKELDQLKFLLLKEFNDDLIHLTCLTKREEMEIEFKKKTNAQVL